MFRPICHFLSFGIFLVLVALLFPSIAFTQSPSGPFAYVTNHGDGTVSKINTSTNTVAATIPLCTDCTAEPAGLAVTPGGKFVYVADQRRGAVAVIDTTSNTVTTTIFLPVFGVGVPSAVDVAARADGTRVYVTDVGQSRIDVIDTSTNTVVFPTSPDAEGDVSSLNGPIVTTPDGSAAFYTFGTGSLGRFDTTTNTHTTTITVGSNPKGVAVTPDGSRLYVANSGDNSVSVIANSFPNFPTLATVQLASGAGPFSLAVTPDGKSVYVINQANATASVISTATNTVATTIPSSDFNCLFTLNQIAITSDGSQAFVADTICGAFPINTATNTVSSAISLGSNPYGVAASGSQTKLLGPPGTTTKFIFDTDTYKTTPLTNRGGEQVTVDAFFVPASKFPTIAGFSNETCTPVKDYSVGGVDMCLEFQVHCQLSPTDTTPCDFIYLVAAGYDLPADLSGGTGGNDFLVAHGVDCPLTGSSIVQSIFTFYEATVFDPTTHGGSKGPSCFVVTYTPGAPPISSGTSARFTGWGPPVADGELNQVKAGSTVPLSFQFFDVLGNPVTNLSFCNSFSFTAGVNVCNDSLSFPTPWVNIAAFPIACPNSAPVNTSTDTTFAAAGASGLQNLGGGSYQVNWKTAKSLKGSCANVVVTFDSGLTVIPAMMGFQFN